MSGRRKLRVIVGKNKVMRCSRCVNVGRMDLRLNGEPLEELNCCQLLGSQVVADVACKSYVVLRINEEYKVSGTLKCVLSNRGLGIKAKKCI